MMDLDPGWAALFGAVVGGVMVTVGSLALRIVQEDRERFRAICAIEAEIAALSEILDDHRRLLTPVEEMTWGHLRSILDMYWTTEIPVSFYPESFRQLRSGIADTWTSEFFFSLRAVMGKARMLRSLASDPETYADPKRGVEEHIEGFLELVDVVVAASREALCSIESVKDDMPPWASG